MRLVTKKIQERGYDIVAEIHGSGVEAIAHVWWQGDYIGQLEKAHICRGNTLTWQAKGSGPTIGKNSLLDACRDLYSRFKKEQS